MQDHLDDDDDVFACGCCYSLHSFLLLSYLHREETDHVFDKEKTNPWSGAPILYWCGQPSGHVTLLRGLAPLSMVKREELGPPKSLHKEFYGQRDAARQ